MLANFAAFFPLLRRSNPKAQLKRNLTSLERQARTAPADSKPRLYNRLGDLCVRAGETERALRYYGRGIDAYLSIGHFDPAAALCRKIIQIAPGVVRARCTLAFLSLGKGMAGDATDQISEYVAAAKHRGQESLAITRLRMMARATDDYNVRLFIAEQLLKLGDARGSNEIAGAVQMEGVKLRSFPHAEQRERWAELLRIGITGTVQQQERALAGVD